MLRELLLLWLAAACAATAQTNLGAIVGSVRDSTGAFISSARIVLSNEGTGVTRQVASTSAGDFEFPDLVPGRYDLAVEQPGFKKFVRAGVVVDAYRTVRVDVALEIGALTEQVRVEATAPVIETETPSISSRITAETFSKSAVTRSLRPWEALATLPNLQSGPSQFVYSLAGGRGGQTEFQIDGIASPKGGAPLGSSSMSMVGTSELTVQAVNNSAEYSQPGIFQQVSRAGANEFHGEALYNHNNSVLNARSFFTPTKPPSHAHQFGFWMGAPLVIPGVYDGHNRTFIMLATEDSVSPGSGNANATVPNSAMRAGNFSAFKAITDPATGQPFPGNLIPATRISSVAGKLQQMFYPLPNFGGDVFASLNERVLFNSRTHFFNIDLRVDQKISSKNTLYGRFGWIQFNNATLEASLLTVGKRSQIRNLRNGVLSDTHVFSPAVINEFRLGEQRSKNPFHGPQKGLAVLQAVGIQGVNNVPDSYGIPVINVTGLQSLTQINTAVNVEQTPQINDAVTWVRGRHNFRFGLDLRRAQPNSTNVPTGTYGTFNFTGTFTGNAYSDFLLGIPQQSSRAFPAPPNYLRQWQDGFFVTDDFKVSSRLMLQLGMRYEYQTPTTHLRDSLYNFDPATGRIVLVAGDSRRYISPTFNPSLPVVVADGSNFPGRALWRSDTNNFGPRLGFAWRPTGAADFAVRGGYGVYYETLGYGVAGNQEGGPYTPGAQTFTNQVAGGKPLFQFPLAYPDAPVGPSTAPPSLTAIISNVRNPAIQQWNLTVEKAVHGIGLRASYIGSKDTQLLYQRNINKPLPGAAPFAQNRRPYPLYGEIVLTDQGGNSSYNAFQFEATRRYSSLTFNFGYTWSNLIADVPDGGGDVGAVIENPNNRAAERAREPYSFAQRFVGNAVWALPAGKGRRFLSAVPAIVDQIFGWETIWTVQLHTGGWFTPSFSGADISNTNTLNGRPDRVANGNLADPTLTRWFDPSAFVVPPANAGRYGNSGRDVLEGPGLAVLHLNLSKSFSLEKIRRGMRVTFQMAAQNLLNHPNFDNPTANIRDPNVARISGLNSGLEFGNGRTLQARLRVAW